MAYKSGKCYVCEEMRPVQSHHIIPVAYGGPKNGPQVDLCPSCHTVCHYEAEHYTQSGAFNMLGSVFSGAALKRASEIVTRIANAKLKHKTSGAVAEDARRGVHVHFSHDEMVMVKAMKRVMGAKSLDRLVRACVLAQIRDLRKAGKL